MRWGEILKAELALGELLRVQEKTLELPNKGPLLLPTHAGVMVFCDGAMGEVVLVGADVVGVRFAAPKSVVDPCVRATLEAPVLYARNKVVLVGEKLLGH